MVIYISAVYEARQNVWLTHVFCLFTVQHEDFPGPFHWILPLNLFLFLFLLFPAILHFS
jgi:hypothetical protein